MSEDIQSYLDFQRTAHSPFHVVSTLRKLFLQQGFEERSLGREWGLSSSSKSFVVHPEGKTLIAFILPQKAPEETGFMVGAAHTDSPVLRLRLLPWAKRETYSLLQTQVHGGVIFRSWLDRPLVLAGKVYKAAPQGNGVWNKVQSQLVASSKPIGMIPDLAIHLDREKNKVGEIDPEKWLHLVLGTSAKEQDIKAVWKALNCEFEPDAWELSLSPAWHHTLTGLHDEFIVGPRHDDLAMVWTCAKALSQMQPKGLKQTAVGAFFDAEETGSLTSSGASSTFLKDILQQICHETSKHPLSLPFALSKSFVVSADMAHGLHPAFPNKHDENHRPLINGGIVIKENANDRYATSGLSTSVFKGFCQEGSVPVQNFVIRQDLSCGTTIGPILSAQLSCPVVDIGAAMWGMHSAGEVMGTEDLAHARKAFQMCFVGA